MKLIAGRFRQLSGIRLVSLIVFQEAAVVQFN
jgi:hypothetical protein